MRSAWLLTIAFALALAGCDTGTGAGDEEESAEVLGGFASLSRGSEKLSAADLASADPIEIEYELDFGAEPFDAVDDRASLTDGGRRLLDADTVGGSSLYSEVFAFEVLCRGEYASLAKLADEVEYEDEAGKKPDYVISIGSQRIGVQVSRAYHYPPGEPYLLAQATALLEKKLDDIAASAQNVKASDAWAKQVLAIIAYDAQHAEQVEAAWLALAAAAKGNTILCLVATEGDDGFLYE